MRTLLDTCILAALLPAVGCSTNPSLTKEQLGALVFSDAALSRPPGQSCADCHPRLSNCGLDVEKMDTTFLDPKNGHNVHTVRCLDCHPKGEPKKK